jgi:hypothetical protein
MTTTQALLVFLGIPLAIFGSIVGLVFALSSRGDRSSRPYAPPLGVAAAPGACDIRTDTDGRTVHEPATTDAGHPICWTLTCTECGSPYQEGSLDVHFTDAGQAVAVGRARGWALVGQRMRCPKCA